MTDFTKERKIIDVWAQPPYKPMFEHLPEVEYLFKQSKSPVYKWMSKETSDFLPPEKLVKQMNEANVDKLMLCGWNRPGKVLIPNDVIAKYVSHAPDRFKGIVSIDLKHPLKALDEIDYYVKNYNFKGVRVVPWLWELPITHRYYYPIFCKCVQLDIPFCTQVGHTGPLMPSETGKPVPYVDQVALDFPDLKLVCGHIGYPWTEEMIGCAWKHKNVYIDTSAYLPTYYPKQLLHYINTYGSNKVMFGTNYPQLTLNNCTKAALKLKIRKSSLEKFLYKNAVRVFNLDESRHTEPFRNESHHNDGYRKKVKVLFSSKL